MGEAESKGQGVTVDEPPRRRKLNQSEFLAVTMLPMPVLGLLTHTWPMAVIGGIGLLFLVGCALYERKHPRS